MLLALSPPRGRCHPRPLGAGLFLCTSPELERLWSKCLCVHLQGECVQGPRHLRLHIAPLTSGETGPQVGHVYPMVKPLPFTSMFRPQLDRPRDLVCT